MPTVKNIISSAHNITRVCVIYVCNIQIKHYRRLIKKSKGKEKKVLFYNCSSNIYSLIERALGIAFRLSVFAGLSKNDGVAHFRETSVYGNNNLYSPLCVIRVL